MKSNKQSEREKPQWIPGDVWTVVDNGKSLVVQIVKDCRKWRGNLEFCVAFWIENGSNLNDQLTEYPKGMIFFPLRSLSARDQRFKFSGNHKLNDRLCRLSSDFRARLAHAPLVNEVDKGCFLWDGVSDPEYIYGLTNDDIINFPIASMVLTEGLFNIANS
jgi:hypothetical protein